MSSIASIFKDNGINNPNELTLGIVDIAEQAGTVLMDYYYGCPEDLKTEIKGDGSPVSEADKASNELIETKLKCLTPDITIVSEENNTDPEPGEPYWSIDPLDGTKLFINGTDGFAVMMALIIDEQPRIGVVHCPVYGLSYMSYEGSPSFKIKHGVAEQLKTRKAFNKGDLTTHFDLAHAKEDTYELAKDKLVPRDLILPDPYTERLFPHNLLVAEGHADLHVKTGKDITFKATSGRSWDNAADCIILRNAGGEMVEIGFDQNGNITGKAISFTDPRGKMPAYISFGDKALANKVFPELRR